MMKARFLFLGIMLSFIIGSASSASAYVWSGNFSNLNQDTTFSFGDGTNNLNIEWRMASLYTSVLFGFNDYHTNPGYSDAWVDNVGSSIDINTFDAEPGDWHDAFDYIAAGQWIALKGLNGYYGVLHIETLFSSSPGPAPYISGTWYFQDDGTSYFGSAVPIPSTIVLFGVGLLGLAGVSRKKK